MVYQLIYRSKATSDITSKMVDAILDKASINNKKLQITGCLLVKGAYFLQFIEGKKDVVEKLFYKIKDDNRHDFVEILKEDMSEKRIFVEWFMGFANLDNTDVFGVDHKTGKDFIKLQLDKEQNNLTKKVFWYNVEKLITSSGFYSV